MKRPYWPVHPDDGGSWWYYIWRCFCIGRKPPPIPRSSHLAASERSGVPEDRARIGDFRNIGEEPGEIVSGHVGHPPTESETDDG